MVPSPMHSIDDVCDTMNRHMREMTKELSLDSQEFQMVTTFALTLQGTHEDVGLHRTTLFVQLRRLVCTTVVQ